jgi:hypothetical protein
MWQFVCLAGFMVLFAMALSNSKFGGNFKFDAEPRPEAKIEAPIDQIETPKETDETSELMLNCIREDNHKQAPITTPVEKDGRKQKK